ELRAVTQHRFARSRLEPSVGFETQVRATPEVYETASAQRNAASIEATVFRHTVQKSLCFQCSRHRLHLREPLREPRSLRLLSITHGLVLFLVPTRGDACRALPGQTKHNSGHTRGVMRMRLCSQRFANAFTNKLTPACEPDVAHRTHPARQSADGGRRRTDA